MFCSDKKKNFNYYWKLFNTVQSHKRISRLGGENYSSRFFSCRVHNRVSGIKWFFLSIFRDFFFSSRKYRYRWENRKTFVIKHTLVRDRPDVLFSGKHGNRWTPLWNRFARNVKKKKESSEKYICHNIYYYIILTAARNNTNDIWYCLFFVRRERNSAVSPAFGGKRGNSKTVSVSYTYAHTARYYYYYILLR